MQLHRDGTLVVSATDLVGFLACDHLATLELGAAAGLWERAHEREDPEVVLLQERGEAHERGFLARLRAEGRDVVELEPPEPRTPEGYRAAESRTLEAMRAGAGAIYQAVLFDGRWLGYADFLVRIDRPSALGAWSYEVADTKLARAVKAGAVLQVCVYSDRLERLQGLRPQHVHVVTGDGGTTTLRLDDYAAYYRAVRARFEAEVFGDPADDGPGDPPARAGRRDPATAATYPDPVDHCRVCAWFPVCMDRRRADDHLSLVAGMSRNATARLVAAGVPTLAALGRLESSRTVADLEPRTLERVREQARIQLAGREAGRTEREPLWEPIPPRPEEPHRGLALLPEPSPLDLFFDIEADPWLDLHGREYLLGVLSIDGDAPAYVPLWSHDAAEERRAFERFVDQVMERLARDPRMHIYHYGGYESGAIKRLMQRYATREEEVDVILRAGVLVDLLNVVRQGIRASVESYSLKSVEHLFAFDRQGRLTRAGFSVVEYEQWLRDGEQRHLDDLAAYNGDDCLATLGLRDWLEARRAEAVGLGWDLPRPEARDGAPSVAVEAANAETQRRIEALRAAIPVDPALRDREQDARWLLASLLDYHRREAKPEWWRWFELKDKATAEDLVEASDAIGRLEYAADVGSARSTVLQRFRFPPQDHRFHRGDQPVDPATGGAAGTVVELDDAEGWLVLRRSTARAEVHPAALIPASPIPTDVLRRGLGRLADRVIERGLDGVGPYRAAVDLLSRRPPRLRTGEIGAPGSAALRSLSGSAADRPLRQPDDPAVDTAQWLPGRSRDTALRQPGESAVEAARRLVVDLDDSALPVQGPPGTGKTYTGARMVIAALAAGRGPVGVTAQSHRTITNFLEALDEAAREAGRSPRVVQKCETPDHGGHLRSVRVVADNAAVAQALDEGVDVVAGTAWLFAREELDGRLGMLVVDEAGQLALATVLAVSGSTRSILLLGDPNQLAQVTQGLHPEGADASALAHVLGEHATLPDDRGLFLDATWRMHPDVNAYVSATFYEGRLATEPSTAVQRVDAPAPIGITGIRWLPVRHARNEQRSREEAAVVAGIVDGLIGMPWTDRHGEPRYLSLDDLLVVAPYNAHVAQVQAAIAERLGPVRHDRVGTVDKFQGREGAVAIYTMAASSAEDAPRGMEFLYDVHRLNVAVSRARAVAVVVASPELLRVAARTPEQMRLANALCRFVEVAAEQSRRAS